MKTKTRRPLRVLTDVTADNVGERGFFCYMSKKKAAGYGRKLQWLEARFAEGMRIKMLPPPDRGFIEYLPGEHAWRAIHADGYLVIHCLWVVGKSKGWSYGRALVEACLRDAKRDRKKGVAMVTSEKPWLASRGPLESLGFKCADEAPPAFSLMVKRFNRKHPLPRFAGGWDDKARACGSGLTVLRSDQCPYIDDGTAMALQSAHAAGVEARVIELSSRDDVLRLSPSPYGVFGLVLDGELLSYLYMLPKDLDPLLQARGKGRRAMKPAKPTAPIDWLLGGPPFVRYRTLLDLVGKPRTHRDVKAAYAEMLADPLVEQLASEVNDWESQRPITRHNDAAHPLHKLVFLADLGLTRRHLKPAVAAILAHQSQDGPFSVRIEIPKAFGGDGIAKWDWVATDAPLLLYSLLRLGVRNKKVMKGVEHICSRIGDPAFSCFASSTMGRFKGPGRKGDPCPYANLIILRMLAEVPELRDCPEASRAAAMLLQHWQERGKQKHFLFGIGTDFKKPKAPLIWYDIVHYTDTLSRFPWARQDGRLREVVAQLESGADGEGRLTSASVWMKWKGWEFCQKKEPSYWLTFLLHRALRRLAG